MQNTYLLPVDGGGVEGLPAPLSGDDDGGGDDGFP
jgi:hypothetical protein